MQLLQQVNEQLNEQELLREATELVLEGHAAEVLAEDATAQWSAGMSSTDLFEELGI